MQTSLKRGLILIVSVSALALFASYVTNENRSTRICHDCVKDEFKRVSLHDLIDDVARYRGTHMKDITADMRAHTYQKEPSRSCTYTFDTLKKFMCLVETYSKMAGIEPKDLAIRFVYGVYPKKEPLYGEQYGSLHTLFMIPAVFQPSTGAFVEFDPELTAHRPKYLEDKLKARQMKLSYPFYALSDLAPLAMQDTSVRVMVLDATSFHKPSRYATRSGSAASSSSALLTTTSYTWNQGMLCPPNCPAPNLVLSADNFYPAGKPW